MFLPSLHALLLLTLGSAFPSSQAETPSADSCRTCHSALEGRLGDPARLFPEDVHAGRGLSCVHCHGGDPQQEDPDKSMDRKRGYQGVPKRAEIPRLCARCHSDGAMMRGYNPSLRIDQLALYLTSVHGKRSRAGDTRVAVCTDCHGVHNIRPASSPLSKAHPLQIPETCGGCHADAERMKPYNIPTDQLAGYRASVHFAALTAGDLSAPTCATCHGSHGAAPPGVSSVERVCGTCHVFQEQLYDQSPHKAPWEAAEIPACLTCHSNHRIERPSDALLSIGKESVCMGCHPADDPGGKIAQRLHVSLTALDADLRESGAMLDRAERAGMEVGEARLTLSNGKEKLIKARVEIHAMNAERVEETSASGRKLAQQATQAGQQALAEHAFRRKGLALLLIVISFVVVSLWLLIRNLERSQASPGETTPS